MKIKPAMNTRKDCRLAIKDSLSFSKWLNKIARAGKNGENG